jgi:chromate reductase
MKKKIFAICGSTRDSSSNLLLLKVIEKLTVTLFDFEIFNELSLLPHFNPDENSDDIPSVRSFRNKIREADGVMICTPEYAHGVPGSLKNAIDWTVGTAEFLQKPTVLITASTDGQFAHQALLETLNVLEAKNMKELNLNIQFIRSKINPNGEITDLEVEKSILNLINKLIYTIGFEDE